MPLRLVAFALILAAIAHSNAQLNVPSNPPATDEQTALAELRQLFSAKTAHYANSISASSIFCGPGLWVGWDGTAPPELQSATQTYSDIHAGKGYERFLGRVFHGDGQLQKFWTLLFETNLTKYPLTFRKPTEFEMAYYREWLPLPTEEPLFVVESSYVRLLFDFTVKDGVPKIFAVDRGDRFSI
jgi:hypothetical protein